MLPITLAGDSILHGRLDATGADTNAIAEALGLPEAQRCALSGSRATQWAVRGNPLLAKALAAPRGLCVLSLLANDAFAALEDGHIDEAEVFAAISAFGYVSRRLSEHHEALMVIQYCDPYFGARLDVRLAVERLNAAILAAVSGTGATLLDLRRLLLPAHYAGNCGGIHPNLDGYRIMADEIAQLAVVPF